MKLLLSATKNETPPCEMIDLITDSNSRRIVYAMIHIDFFGIPIAQFMTGFAEAKKSKSRSRRWFHEHQPT